MLHFLAEHDAQRFDMLSRYYRYDARFERSFFKAWKELKSLQADPELVETKEPEADRNEFAKQTEIKPEQPAPTPNPSPEPPEKPDNDQSTM